VRDIEKEVVNASCEKPSGREWRRKK